MIYDSPRNIETDTIPTVDVESETVLDHVGMRARVLFGEFNGKKSKAKTYNADLFLLDCTLLEAHGNDPENEIFHRVKIELPDNYSTLFVYNLKNSGGEIQIIDNLLDATAEVSEQEIAIRDNKDHDNLRSILQQPNSRNSFYVEPIDTGGEVKTRRFIVGAGVPFGEKSEWVKLLGNDGALIGPSEEYVRSKMKEFEADRDGFGK